MDVWLVCVHDDVVTGALELPRIREIKGILANDVGPLLVALDDATLYLAILVSQELRQRALHDAAPHLRHEFENQLLVTHVDTRHSTWTRGTRAGDVRRHPASHRRPP